MTPDVLDAFRDLARREDATCTVCDAMGRANAMSARVRPAWTGARVFGPAVTARPLGSDLSAVFAAIEAARPGDVIVIDGSGARTAFWGENTTVAAIARGLAGVVIDGHHRDAGAIRRLEFPVFSAGPVPIAGAPAGRGETNAAAQCGGVPVRPGDLILGDENGVVVVPSDRAADVLERARAGLERERETRERLETGVPLGEVMTAVTGGRGR